MQTAVYTAVQTVVKPAVQLFRVESGSPAPSLQWVREGHEGVLDSQGGRLVMEEVTRHQVKAQPSKHCCFLLTIFWIFFNQVLIKFPKLYYIVSKSLCCALFKFVYIRLRSCAFVLMIFVSPKRVLT